jgi:hypothetical protein
MLWMAVEADVAAIGLQRAKHQPCVPFVEMNVESYRRKEALDRKRSRGRPPAHATPKEFERAAD